jgi:6-pyruvoyl-tetrahydropterin synthase
MVADFKDLKAILHEVLDPLDHCMVLAPDDPLVSLAPALKQTFLWLGAENDADNCKLETFLVATNKQKPRLIVWHGNPTAESFAKWAAEEIAGRLPRDITVTHVRVWETVTCHADWYLHEEGL